jgi:hypothetical protein
MPRPRYILARHTEAWLSQSREDFSPLARPNFDPLHREFAADQLGTLKRAMRASGGVTLSREDEDWASDLMMQNVVEYCCLKTEKRVKGKRPNLHAARIRSDLRDALKNLTTAQECFDGMDAETKAYVGNAITSSQDKAMNKRSHRTHVSPAVAFERFGDTLEIMRNEIASLDKNYSGRKEQNFDPTADRLYEKTTLIWFYVTGAWPNSTLWDQLRDLAWDANADRAAKLNEKRFLKTVAIISGDAAERAKALDVKWRPRRN